MTIMNRFKASSLIFWYICTYALSASENCGNCSHELCLSGGFCLYGCKPGYRGGRCWNSCEASECQPNTDCYRDGVLINGQWRYKCELCQDGYYRGATENTFNCSLKCQTNCKSCSNLNHCHECKEPFYNEDVFYNCSRRCPQNCEACLSSTLCMKCKQPYYNDRGVTNCSLACAEQRKETQNREEEVTSMFDKLLRTPEISVVVTFISAVVLTLVVQRTVRLIRRRLDRPSVDKEKDSQTRNQTVGLYEFLEGKQSDQTTDYDTIQNKDTASISTSV